MSYFFITLSIIFTALGLRYWCSRAYWERRAALLDDDARWTVGRTDMYSFTEDPKGRTRNVHYAYAPDGDTSFPFYGNSVSSLRKAVIYAESRNYELDED